VPKLLTKENKNKTKTKMVELNEAIIAYEKKHGARIDYAKPQDWFDAVLNAGLNINPQEYVWVYTKDSGMFGKPLHKDTIIADYWQQYDKIPKGVTA